DFDDVAVAVGLVVQAPLFDVFEHGDLDTFRFAGAVNQLLVEFATVGGGATLSGGEGLGAGKNGRGAQAEDSGQGKYRLLHGDLQVGFRVPSGYSSGIYPRDRIIINTISSMIIHGCVTQRNIFYGQVPSQGHIGGWLARVQSRDGSRDRGNWAPVTTGIP